jgi:hypothetical protein
MIPMTVPDAGYVYYSKGDKQLHMFDGNAVRPPNADEQHHIALYARIAPSVDS